MGTAAPIVHSFNSRVGAYLQPPGGWFLNNAGWLAGPEHTLLIDTCATEERTRLLLAAVETHRPAPDSPLTAAITHAHGDHANGAGLIARSGGTALATGSAASVIADGPHTYPGAFACSTWGDITPPDSMSVVTGPARIEAGGGQVADVLPVPGTAHTDGDLVVWLPRDGVLFTGDLLFDGVTPLSAQGSVRGWLSALDWLSGFEAGQLVPGHGSILRPADGGIDAVAGYLRWLLDVGSADRPDFDDLYRQAAERWPRWSEPERHAANLVVAHAETQNRPVDVIAAFTAMLTAAGGPIELDI